MTLSGQSGLLQLSVETVCWTDDVRIRRSGSAAIRQRETIVNENEEQENKQHQLDPNKFGLFVYVQIDTQDMYVDIY